MTTRPVRFLLLLLSVSCAASLHPQPAERIVVTAKAAPDVQTIIQRAVANDELRRQHRAALECDQLLTTERLEEAGTVFKTKTVHLVYRESEQLTVGADLPAEGRAGHDGDTLKAEHHLAVMNFRKLAPRFQCTLLSEEAVRGHACYVLGYAPRPGQPADTREEKVINGLQGRFWIDKNTYEVLGGEGSLAKPVTVALFASVSRLDFAFHTQELPNGEAAPADFSVDLAFKAPFHFYRKKQTSRLENWRPRGG